MENDEKLTNPKTNDLIPQHHYELTNEEAKNELIKKDNKLDALAVGESVEVDDGLRIEKRENGKFVLWNNTNHTGVTVGRDELKAMRKLWED